MNLPLDTSGAVEQLANGSGEVAMEHHGEVRVGPSHRGRILDEY